MDGRCEIIHVLKSRSQQVKSGGKSKNVTLVIIILSTVLSCFQMQKSFTYMAGAWTVKDLQSAAGLMKFHTFFFYYLRRVVFFACPLPFNRFIKVQKNVSFGGYQMVKVLSQAHGGIEQLILYCHLWESSKSIHTSLLNCQRKKLSEHSCNCSKHCILIRSSLLSFLLLS